MASSRTYSSSFFMIVGAVGSFIVFPWCSAMKKQSIDNCVEETWCSIWSGICVGRRGSAS